MTFLYNIEFLDKWYLLLLLIIPIFIYLFYKKLSNGFEFLFINDLKKIFGNNSYLFYIKILLLFLIFINYILIIANPNIWNTTEIVKKNGIDIVIVLDISGSMEAEDLKPNRMEAAKNVINNFISKIKTDRIWLVIFAWKPFTSIPLTFDYNILTENIDNISTKNINQWINWLNWTAIWDAILMAKTLFKTKKEVKNNNDVTDREKVIILLTDWDANVWVEPTLAWLSAKEEWIKIYTIWIWSEEWWVINYKVWPFNKQQQIPPLNDKKLKQVAYDTNWVYFRADNNNTLEEIFNELSKLNKNDIEINIKKEHKQYYDPFIYNLLLLLWLFIISLLFKKEIPWKYKI